MRSLFLLCIAIAPVQILKSDCTNRASTGLYLGFDLPFGQVTNAIKSQQIMDGKTQVGAIRDATLSYISDSSLKMEVDFESLNSPTKNWRVGMEAKIDLLPVQENSVKISVKETKANWCYTGSGIFAPLIDPVCRSFADNEINRNRTKLEQAINDLINDNLNRRITGQTNFRLHSQICPAAIAIVPYTGDLLSSCKRSLDIFATRNGVQLTSEIRRIYDVCTQKKGNLTFSFNNRKGFNRECQPDTVDFEIIDTGNGAKLFNTGHIGVGQTITWNRPLIGLEGVKLKIGMWDKGFLCLPGSGDGELLFDIPFDGDLNITIHRDRPDR